MKTVARLWFIILLITPWVTSAGASVVPHGISMTGTIRSVDASTRKIVFVQDEGSIRECVWIRWAKFYHDGGAASPAALKPGMRVQVRFHNPVFGPDYVSRIVLLDPPQSHVGGKGGKESLP